jgi:hypothetical protein
VASAGGISLQFSELVAQFLVMPGLVPGIHVFRWVNQGVDGRDKPGHDGSSLDLRKIRDSASSGADAVQKFEAVFAELRILGVHRHLVEEGVDRRPQL